MMRALLLLAIGLLTGCSPSKPVKTDAGVCWRVRADVREVLDRNIANLQTCATRLEAVRMMEGGAVEGAFEGRSIFASEAEITQSPARTGARYPVFTPAEREQVQSAIRKLLDQAPARGGPQTG